MSWQLALVIAVACLSVVAVVVLLAALRLASRFADEWNADEFETFDDERRAA